MKKIAEYILFAINSVCLITICTILTTIIIDNYNWIIIELILLLLIALTIIVINTYLFIKQIKRILISLILFLIIIISCLLLFFSINNIFEDCISESLYKGKIIIENQDKTNTYSVVVLDLIKLIYDNETKFPYSLNLNNNNSNYNELLESEEYRIESCDTIKNEHFSINNYYTCECDVEFEMIKNISKIPIRIYKNGNRLIDTCLYIKPEMIKYNNDRIEIEFYDLKIKNAP